MRSAACALAVLASIGFGAAHAEVLDLVGEISSPDGLEFSVYANYASRSQFASVSAPTDSTEQVRFAAFGQNLTLARDYTNTEDGMLAWHGTDESGSVAILIVEGSDVLGTIESAGGSYAIVPASGGLHEVLEVDDGLFPTLAVPPAASGVSGASGGASHPARVSTLESAYLGWTDYNGNGRGGNAVGGPVTITVMVHYTDEVHSQARSSAQLVRFVEEQANRVYQTNDLNIVIDTLLGDQVQYSEGTKGADAILTDLKNAGTATLRRAHNLAERNNADIMMLLVKDNTPEYTDPHKRTENLLNDDAAACNSIDESLPNSAANALAVVSHTCVMNHYATAAIGMIQGASAYNEPSPEFSYARGYVDMDANKRTVTVPNDADCDDMQTINDRCSGEAIWSDPHRFFFGTRTQAGTVENWNARALFATGPHIASLKGAAQDYDSTRPTGSIALPSSIPTTGSVALRATFSEPIHPSFPPNLTVTDGANTTAATMSRVSDTVYTYSHRLDGETGNTRLLFSDARDRFGNLVVKTPTSGASFTAAAVNVADPSPTSGSLTSLIEEFDSRLAPRWTLSGDGNWSLLAPREQKVPDHPMNSNKVLSSEDCDDSCIATYRSSVSTVEPITISFDRYVDRKIDRNEGLFLEYSAGGGAWRTLASYTQGDDTSRWEREVVGLSVPEPSVQLRFRAESDGAGEIVEVDNLRVTRPTAALPNISFLATLNETRTQVSLVFSRSVPQAMSASDFELVSGSVNAVGGSGATRILKVSDVPPGAPAVVRYVGADVAAAGTELVSGTLAITNTGSRHSAGTHTPVSSGFESLAGWSSAGAPGWRASVPGTYVGQPPGKASSNTAATAEDCDAGCTLTQTSGVNLSTYGSASLSLWQYASSSLDAGEYLRLYVSGDGGSSWDLAVDVGEEQAFGRWTKETVDMSEYLFSTDVRLRLSAKMSNTAEDVAVDDIRVTATRAVPDTTAPTITAPAAVTAEATGSRTTVSLGAAVATDAVDSSPTVTNDAPASGFPLGSTTVTWTATDDAGNSATATQTVTVQDTTPPRISAPAGVNAEASGVRTPLSLGRPSASDLFGPVTVASDAPPSFPLGRTTVTWTATDANGNRASAAQLVTVSDTTPPSVTPPPDASFEATAPSTPIPASRYGTAAASDAVDSSPTVTSNAPSSFPLGRTAVTWTATDDAGNSASAVQTVTVRDTTPPSVTPPPDVSAEASGSLTSVQLGAASATDAADPAVDVSASDLGPFKLGRTAVTWTATDSSGNSAAAIQTVTVRDTSGPAFAAPPDEVLEATGILTPIFLYPRTIADAVDGTLTLTHDAPPSERPGVHEFPLGTTVVTWTATDSSGNANSAVQTVTVRDTTPPRIDTLLMPSRVQTAVPLTRIDSFAQFQVTDLFGVSETGITPELAPLGASVAVFSATDTNGNGGSASVRLLLEQTRTDTHAPAFPAPPDIAVRSSSSTSVQYGDLLIWDNYDPAPQVSCSPQSGSQFEPGTTQVQCTASDGAGNQRHRSFYVLVDASSSTRTLHENRFETGLGSAVHKEADWSQNGRVCGGAGVSTSSATPVYSLSHSEQRGGTAHLRYSEQCWSGHTGVSDSFSVAPGSATSTLAVGFDYRGLADLLGYRHINHVNNLRFVISDSDGRVLDVGKPLNGREQAYLDDSGWRQVTAVVPQVGPGTCPCEIYAYTGDYWSAVWKKQFYFDNFSARLVPPAAAGASGQQAGEARPGQGPEPPNLLTVGELISMQDYADSRVVIVEKRAHEDSVLVSWDHDDWAREYKVVIRPAGDGSARFADTVSDGRGSYRFVNLAPGTEYTVTVGARGDDSTQASVDVRTPGAGERPFDPGLLLSARQDGGQVLLSWTDYNGEDQNRYRVERSVDGGPFAETANQPGAADAASDAVEPDWRGKRVEYRIFEWVGKQKLYSDPVSLVVR